MMRSCAWFMLFILLLIPVFSIQARPSVDSLLQAMTLKEKAGQMILVYNSPYEFLEKYSIGGVLIMQNMLKKPFQLKKKLSLTQKKLTIPVIVSIDQEGGRVNRLSSLKNFKKTPSAQATTRWKQDSIVSYYGKVARTLNNLGINLNLAPVLDPSINFEGRDTYIAHKKRSYGTGISEIVPPASSFTKAFHNEDIGCIVKHFPGYDVDVNSDYKIAVSMADSIAVMKNIAPFKAMEKNYDGIMMSSILYKAFCQEPAVLCQKMVKLAREISPDGIIVTDDLWGTALRSYTYPNKEIETLNYPDSAFTRIVEYALLAGNDMLMITYPKKVESMIATIVKLAQKKPAVLTHIDGAVRRIIALKIRLKLFE